MSIEKKFYVTKEMAKGSVTAHLHGELDLSAASEFRSELEPFISQQDQELILDLSELSYIDSTGIGVFILILKQRNAINGVFRLVGVPRKIKKLFDITGITQHLDIEEGPPVSQERKEDVV
jgi:anti-sigma B factor antagonist